MSRERHRRDPRGDRAGVVDVKNQESCESWASAGEDGVAVVDAGADVLAEAFFAGAGVALRGVVFWPLVVVDEAAFLVVAFLAGAFFAVVFFAAELEDVDFLAGAFFAVDDVLVDEELAF